MHKIADKTFNLDDFSHEHLGVSTRFIDEDGNTEPGIMNLWIESLNKIIDALNVARNYYISESDTNLKKQYWWQMIQLLPSSYNQRRTVMLNYEVLANIYKSRRFHKLDEWREFCKWVKTLPVSELITGNYEDENGMTYKFMEPISGLELTTGKAEAE